MTKYAKLDSEVLSAIGTQPTSFSELFIPSVRQECLVIAEAEEKHPMNAALSAHRLNRNAVSAEHCAECGEDIPAPRRAAVPGCQTCAECQSIIELRNKQRGSQ